MPAAACCGFHRFVVGLQILALICPVNALLYALVVVIWGTTWIAIFLQQGPVAAPVSIFWRFAVASVTMLAILLVTRQKTQQPCSRQQR